MSDTAEGLLREVLASPVHFEGTRSEDMHWDHPDYDRRGVYRYQARRLRTDLIERIQTLVGDGHV